MDFAGLFVKVNISGKIVDVFKCEYNSIIFICDSGKIYHAKCFLDVERSPELFSINISDRIVNIIMRDMKFFFVCDNGVVWLHDSKNFFCKTVKTIRLIKIQIPGIVVDIALTSHDHDLFLCSDGTMYVTRSNKMEKVNSISRVTKVFKIFDDRIFLISDYEVYEGGKQSGLDYQFNKVYSKKNDPVVDFVASCFGIYFIHLSGEVYWCYCYKFLKQSVKVKIPRVRKVIQARTMVTLYTIFLCHDETLWSHFHNFFLDYYQINTLPGKIKKIPKEIVHIAFPIEFRVIIVCKNGKIYTYNPQSSNAVPECISNIKFENKIKLNFGNKMLKSDRTTDTYFSF